MTTTITVQVEQPDVERIIAALTVAAERAPEAFRPTLARAYEWLGETAPPDYAEGDNVWICTDNGSWIPAVVLGVGPHGVRVAYQHNSPNGPYTTTLTREAVRRWAPQQLRSSTPTPRSLTG